MAKLPTEQDLGPSPSLESRRGIASYDVSPLAKGQAAMAAAVQQVGGALLNTGLQGLEREKRQGETLEDAQAQADLLTASAKRRSEIGDATDSADLEKKHREGAQADLEAAANRIQDPNRRALFLERARPTIETLGVAAKDKAFNISSDAKRAEVYGQLEDLKQKAVLDKDAAHQGDYVTTGRGLISGLEKDGYLTAVEAEKQRQSWGQSYAYDRIMSLSPQERVESLTPVQTGDRTKQAYDYFTKQGWSPVAAAGIVGGLVHESHLTTTARNPGDGSDGSDSIGVAQWNSGRAANLKAFAAARGKPSTDYETQLAFVDHELRTTETGPAAKLNAATNPREAAAAFVTFERPQGYERGAASAHGWGNRLRQAEGIHAAYAGGKLSMDPAGGIGQYVPANQRAAIVDAAEREMQTGFRAQQQARAADSATVRSLMKDDEASIMRSGQPVADLTTERVKDALGPQAAAEFESNRKQAVEFNHQTSDWDQIPVEQIRARLDALRPAPGTAGYDSAQQYFSIAEKQAAAVQKERQTDPAAAADKTPEVRAALQGASLDKPESYQAVAKARAIAQERLRIPEDLRVPMTRAEAQQVAKPLELAQQGGDPREIRDVLTDTVKQLQSGFGEQSDTALQQVIKEAHIGRAGAEMAAVVLRKLANRETPTVQDARALDEAQKTSAADRAVAPVARPAGTSLPLNFDPTAGATGTDYLNPQAPAAAKPTFPTPDAGAVDMLRKKPDLARQFDKTYGPGASERVMAIAGTRP